MIFGGPLLWCCTPKWANAIASTVMVPINSLSCINLFSATCSNPDVVPGPFTAANDWWLCTWGRSQLGQFFTASKHSRLHLITNSITEYSHFADYPYWRLPWILQGALSRMSNLSKTALPGARATVDAEVCLVYTMSPQCITDCFCCCVP